MRSTKQTLEKSKFSFYFLISFSAYEICSPRSNTTNTTVMGKSLIDKMILYLNQTVHYEINDEKMATMPVNGTRLLQTSTTSLTSNNSTTTDSTEESNSTSTNSTTSSDSIATEMTSSNSTSNNSTYPSYSTTNNSTTSNNSTATNET